MKLLKLRAPNVNPMEALHVGGLGLIATGIAALAGWPWAAIFCGCAMVLAYWLDALRGARGGNE